MQPGTPYVIAACEVRLSRRLVSAGTGAVVGTGPANVLRRSATSRGSRRGAWPWLAAGRARGGFGGGSARPAAAGLAVVLAVKGRAVFQDRVELPGFAVRGVLDPELVLLGVAAGGVAFIRQVEPGGGQSGLLGVDGTDVGDLDAEVVQAAAMAGVLQQDELERRLGDGEVRVPGAALGGRGAEQLAVEGDGLVDVVDVEGELDTGHRNLQETRHRRSSMSSRSSVCHMTSTNVNIDTCRTPWSC